MFLNKKLKTIESHSRDLINMVSELLKTIPVVHSSTKFRLNRTTFAQVMVLTNTYKYT